MPDSDSELEQPPNSKFIETYKCVPLAKSVQKNIQRGGKLLLPSSALEQISFLDISTPFMFKVTNNINGRSTHAGVYEFTAEAGEVCVPQWMIKNLGIPLGGSVVVESVSLPAATFCRLEPLTRNFAYISDVKTVMEENLKYFTCLTEGDTLFIHESNMNQMYKVKVLETKPESAVGVLDCDMEVELSMPEKPKRPTRNSSPEKKQSKIQTNFRPFQGQGQRIDGGEVKTPDSEPKKGDTSFVPFKGKGYSLKNRKHKHENDNDGPQKKKSRLNKDDSNIPNKLIFIRKIQKEFVKKQSKEEINPFQGQGNSLKDN
ncbi:ubiquitin recognition factor in ER-associated degradation protein 1-like [Homalodisca vitripennis]|uniref:ubiquitin recognition factor in ER-associated degradation protein 1-like n=1 Tax=Homalodisca vitripennis TaxID=197043 RepID=UPI001EEAD33F|nr:ubiquitin recognition factor in ER-associated degradation protein 1-like [Homalodisca vitripennis]